MIINYYIECRQSVMPEDVCSSLWHQLSATGEDRFPKKWPFILLDRDIQSLLPKSPKRAQRNKTIWDPNTDSKQNTLQ